MATISDETRSIIDRYIAELEKNDIPIQEAVVFGSYSKGQADQWSDIDIALVSDAFEGLRIQDRKKIGVSPYP
jgi:predicted nucleotidyltransferase